MKTVFFGASKYVLPLIEMLNKNFDLALVVTTEMNPQDTIPGFCSKNNIAYISVKTVSQALEKIKNENAEIGVLASFGLLLSDELLNIFPKGIINIHPSLLPKYRGPTPVQTAILNGDTKTGVSIIKLDEELDHGPILVQKEETILPTDTSQSLYERLFLQGTKLLKENLSAYVKDKLTSLKQDDKQATFTKPVLTKNDGYIDLNSLEIGNWKLEIARKIRAYYPWPTVWTRIKINGAEKIVKFLPENKLQVEGKKPVSLKDFLNGYPELKNMVINLF